MRFLLALICLWVLEIWVAAVVASQIGIPLTALTIILLSLVGLWLTKSEGVAAWRSVRADIDAGKSPAPGIVDGWLRLVGSGLLIMPGFITATAGALLLIRPIRAMVRGPVLAWLVRRGSAAVRTVRIDGLVVNGSGGTSWNVGGHPGAGASRDPDVIDAQGWEVTDDRELSSSVEHRDNPGSPPS